MKLNDLLRRALIYWLLVLAGWEVSAQDSATPATAAPAVEHVIMISFDGFRSDYPARWNLPNFQRLAREGASATGLIPVYPSKTFPNHYSLVTGLYPGNHGLVDNSFYSRLTAANYSISDRAAVEDARYYGGLPLWQYLQNNGIPTASYFWVGSEAPVAAQYPLYYRPYDATVSNEARISQVLDWLALPDETRPRFITLYFSFVDSVAHETGPESDQTHEAALLADALLGQILAGIETLPLEADVLVVSDHGMREVVHEPATYIDASTLGLDQEDGKLVISQTQAHLYINNATETEAIYSSLKAKENHFSVYRKQDSPSRWHYAASDNTGDILIVADPGYVIVSSLEREFAGNRRQRGEGYGVHGYDAYEDPSMNGIFFAWGPSIKPGTSVAAFENIHVFPFVTGLFGIAELAGIDGNKDVLLPIRMK